MLNEYLENQQIDHIFTDLVENYMELLFSIIVQSCFFCKDPSHHQLLLHISVLIFIKDDEEAQSWDQLLGWLHWHFFITWLSSNCYQSRVGRSVPISSTGWALLSVQFFIVLFSVYSLGTAQWSAGLRNSEFYGFLTPPKELASLGGAYVKTL